MVEPMPDERVAVTKNASDKTPSLSQNAPRDASRRRAFLLAAGASATALLAAGTVETGLAANPSADGADSERPAMRSAQKQRTDSARDISASDVAALPPLGVIAHSRMGFGPRPGDLALFHGLGATDSERLRAYVEQQLAPDGIDDADCDARLAAEGLTTLNKSLKTLWADHVLGDGGRYLPVEEVERATLIRALYSKRQLVEVLADYLAQPLQYLCLGLLDRPGLRGL